MTYKSLISQIKGSKNVLIKMVLVVESVQYGLRCPKSTQDDLLISGNLGKITNGIDYFKFS